MNILLAIDSSDSSEAAVSAVAARPLPTASKVCVLHVLDLFTLPSAHTGAGSFIDVEIEAARSLVKSAADRLASSGLEVMTEVTKGYPPTGIVEYAGDWGADFVIVGSHGRSSIMRFLLGSVAHAVVRHAPCSVEIVRRRADESEQYDPAMRILLATDGSDHSTAAARSIAARPWPEGSQVKVISVIQMIEPWAGIPEATARIENNILEQGEEDIAPASKILATTGMKVTSSVLKGYPQSVIVDEASKWGADLIIVGSHGRRGIRRVLMGSVSEAVAMHAHCSVEVIRDSAVIEN